MNQNPEQLARDEKHRQLIACGWDVQPFKEKKIAAGLGVAFCEYPIDTGPSDYILFVNRKKPLGVIEVKRKEKGLKLAMQEEQYFDSFQIGLTATPVNRTLSYFETNIVSDYEFKKAVEDGL